MTITLIVVGYLAVMVGIGFYARRRVNNATDYHLAGRRLARRHRDRRRQLRRHGREGVRRLGLSAGWYVVCAGIGILLVSFVAPAMRRAMATTVPEVIGRRYGTASQSITAVLGAVALVALGAVQITATATIVSTLVGLPLATAILVTGGGVVLYTWLGGMWSVTLTDFVQFFVIVGGFALALPFALHAAGGWQSVAARLPEGQLGFTSVGWPTIIGLIVLYFMTFSTGQEAVQRYYAARTPKVAVLGSVLCGGLMSLYAFIPAVLGLIALAVYPDIDPNNALAHSAVGLLPPVLAGLLLSAVMSATLSSASGDLLGASTIYIKDLHPRLFGAVGSDERELRLSRVGVLVVGVLATGIALVSQAIIPLLIFAFTMRSAGPFAAFVFSLVWRRTSRLAGLVSIVLGTVCGVAWQLAGEPFELAAIIVGGTASVVSFLAVHFVDRRRDRLTGDRLPPDAAASGVRETATS